MAKRSQKRVPQSERDHLGCISGLISIFDFRQGRSTRRLISDRRRGNGKPPLGIALPKGTPDCPKSCDQHHAEEVTGIHTLMDGSESRRTNIELGKTSVKTLMDEELTKVQKSKKRFPTPVLEQIRRDLEKQRSLENSLRQANCNPRLDSHTSKIDIFPLVEELCRHNINGLDIASYQKIKQLGDKHSTLKEILGEALETFLSQKFIEARQHNGDGVHQSDDLEDALDISNSNKELFVKLLQDPDSPLMKHIEDLRTAQSEKLSKIESCKAFAGPQFTNKECHSSEKQQALEKQDQFQTQGRHHKFFRRKDKSRDKTPPKTSDVNGDTSNTIVILKPSQSPQQSLFWLGDIKRKLQSTIGERRKERHWTLKDKMTHKCQTSTTETETSSRTETTSKISRGSRTREKSGKTKEFISQQKESSIYKEAKKHLADMLSLEDETEDFTVRQVPKPLERILTLAEYYISSPRFSPGRSNKPSPIPEQASSSLKDNYTICTAGHISPVKKEHPSDHSSPPRQDAEDSHKPVVQVEKPNPISEFEGILVDGTTEQHESMMYFFIAEDMKIEQNSEEVLMEENKLLDGPRKLHSFEEIEIESCEENSTGHSTQVYSEEKSYLLSVPESFSAGSIIINNNQTADNVYEKPDRPSPVSVLEQPFSDDDVSPSGIIAQHGESSIQPRRIHFEEHEDSAVTSLDREICLHTSARNNDSNFEYIKKVIEASGLSFDELKGTCPFSDPPLNPSLFDEVEAPNRLFSEDKKLLFYCINEVLTEIYERFFGHSPWVSFVKTETRPIPQGKNILQEVLNGIDHNPLPPGPCTLDQIVGKDMAKDRTWMDVRLHAEEIGFEMEDAILDKIMEETILELWD